MDRVSSVIGVEPARVEHVGALSTTINTDLLAGLLKDVGGYPMVMVLNFERLISKEFADIANLSRSMGHAAFSAGRKCRRKKTAMNCNW